MGYRNSYLLGVIFEEALILSLLGFVPGLIVSLGAYQLTAAATAFPLAMPVSRTILVLLLTIDWHPFGRNAIASLDRLLTVAKPGLLCTLGLRLRF